MGPHAATPRLAATAAALAFALTCAPSQQPLAPPPRSVPAPVDFATSQSDNLFSVLRSQEQIHEWEEARTELTAGEHRAAVERLYRLLQTESGGVVPVGPGRFLGLRLAIVLTLANLPAAATAEYEALVGRELGSTPRDLATCTIATLERFADRFPASSLGQRSRIRLGDLALEAGQGQLAATHFRSALDATPIGSSEEQRVYSRLRLCSVLVDPITARADSARAATDPADDDVLDTLPESALPTLHRAYGGGGTGRTPMPNPAGHPDTQRSEQVFAPEFTNREIGLFAMHAVGDLDGICIATGREVVSLDPLRSKVQWVSRSPLGNSRADYSDSTNQDMVLAAAIGSDIVVAALQVPEGSANVDFHGGIRIMYKMPQRRLFAWDRASGLQLWSHFDEIEGPRTRKFRGHDSCANPIVAGDTVFAPMHDRSGAIAFSVGAYDLRTGQVKWRRLVCSSQQDVNMFGNARMEFAASPLSLHDGVLYGAANLGVSYAIEAGTGRIRWITAYDVVRMPRAMLHQQAERQVYFANNVPVVNRHVVAMMPLDSQFVLGLDTESGRALWRLPAEATVAGTDHHVVWLAGALGDEFVLSGRGIVAVRARPDSPLGERAEVRQLVAPQTLNVPVDRRLAARPALSANRLFVPRQDRVLIFERDGQPATPPAWSLPRYQPGNLTLVNGIAVSVRQGSFDVLFDGAALLRRVQEQAQQAPDDPETLLRAASLQRALLPVEASAAAREEVLQLYRQGLQACVQRGLPKEHPTRLALQRELFDHAQLIAHAAAESGTSDVETVRALLVQSRDAAPDAKSWVEEQAMLLQRTPEPAARAAELQRLLQEAADATFPLGDGVPVPAYVAWQQALLAENEPARATACWQHLLENYGAVQLGDETAQAIAFTAIERLLRQHGPACYAAIAARADAALQAAKGDAEALRTLANRFPNSTAAATARAQLLDVAVRAGDLATACAVLAQAQAIETVPPGLLRRVMAAAQNRGNTALAAALANRLLAHAQVASDWPDDAGAKYGDVVRQQLPATEPAAALPAVPTFDGPRILPRNAREFLRLLPVLRMPGLPAPADTPLYVVTGNELRAIDVHASGTDKPVLFSASIDFLEHVVLCGDTLVVPDMGRAFAIDYRSGAPRWQLANPKDRQIESLGLQQGVLHVSLQPKSSGGSELLGIEPLTGAVLFVRQQDADHLRPKATRDGILSMTMGADGAVQVEWIDPVSGAPLRKLLLADGSGKGHFGLAPDSVAARLYPLNLASDGTRLLLPMDGSQSGSPARVVALAPDGSAAWTWNGAAGSTLPLVACRGEVTVVVESASSQAGKVVLLRSTDGQVLRSIEIGIDPTVLNWERTWLANPAPPLLAIESFADAERQQRQLVVFPLDDRAPFVIPLGREDGEIVQAPQFGADFVAFATRPRKGEDRARLHVLTLRDRSGALPDGSKHRRLNVPGACDGLQLVGDRLCATGHQGLLLLGPPESPR